MKNVRLPAIAGLLLSLTLLNPPSPAFASSAISGEDPFADLARDGQLLSELEELARSCVVRPYVQGPNGRVEYLALRSLCREIQVVAPGRARIFMRGLRQGQALQAIIRESQHADGGDLNDLTILSPRGRAIARMEAVPAFNDVLLALTGGKELFRKVLASPRDRQ